MDAQFWHERWENNQIGFHQEEVHFYLQEFWSHLQLPVNQEVLVPLCGKTNDMLWLLEQGYRVLGIELSSLAIAAFYEENKLIPIKKQYGSFTSWELDEIRILEGDYFALTSAETIEIAAVYDRASLIALPKKMRIAYVQQLATLLKVGTKVLLITLNYPLKEEETPPFSVSTEEVYQLYRDHFAIELFASKDVPTQSPRLQTQGINHLTESAYLLKRS